jgi:hypothetical protein
MVGSRMWNTSIPQTATKFIAVRGPVPQDTGSTEHYTLMVLPVTVRTLLCLPLENVGRP